jgi:hypothetical protein
VRNAGQAEPQSHRRDRISDASGPRGSQSRNIQTPKRHLLWVHLMGNIGAGRADEIFMFLFDVPFETCCRSCSRHAIETGLQTISFAVVFSLCVNLEVFSDVVQFTSTSLCSRYGSVTAVSGFLWFLGAFLNRRVGSARAVR